MVTNGGLSGTITNGTTDFIYNPRWQCLEERDASDNPTNQYVWGIYIDDLLQQKVDISGTPADQYPLQDLLYRTIALTDDEGAIIEAYDYDAYGNTLIFTAPGTGGNWWAQDVVQCQSAACSHLYTGRRLDAETKLYAYRLRFYIPQRGCFTGRDPLDFGYAYVVKGRRNDLTTGLLAYRARCFSVRLGRFPSTDNMVYANPANVYGYAGASPVNGVDPFGDDWIGVEDGTVFWMPENWFGIDDPSSAEVLGMVDDHGAVHFHPSWQLGSRPIPYAALEGIVGHGNTADEVIDKIRAEQSGHIGPGLHGLNIADYWHHRVTCEECRDKEGQEAAELACGRRMAGIVADGFRYYLAWSVFEGFAAGALASVVSKAPSVIVQIAGWAVVAYSGYAAVRDLTTAMAIKLVGEAAGKKYCDCSNIVK